MKNPNRRDGWGHWLCVLGSLGMVLGAVDPLEGSVVILSGSGLVVLGSWLSRAAAPWRRYRLTVFILIGLGVGALFGLSALGGFGGKSGVSNWWGLLLLPYLAGWLMGILGPGHPRWLAWPGLAVGLWYLTLGSIVLSRPVREETYVLAGVLGTAGLTAIAGSLVRLIKKTPPATNCPPNPSGNAG